VLLAVVATLLVAVGGATLVGAIAGDDPGPACEGSETVSLAAATEIAPVLRTASNALEAAEASAQGACLDYEVAATGPEQVTRTLSSEPEVAPDLWVPDFSAWVARATGSGASPAQLSASLATSPVVVVGRNVDRPASWQEVGRSTVTYLDPLTSSASTAALLSAFGEVTRTGASKAEVGAMIVPLAQRYGGQPDRPETVEDVAEAAAEGELGVMSEQQLVRLQADGVGEGLSATVPESGTMVLDYPLVALSKDDVVREAGRRLAGYLAGPEGVELLARQGFRDTTRSPLEGDLATGVEQVDVIPLPDAETLAETLRRWAVLTVPSRSLAVVDVSGSMDFVDGDESRIDLAVAAADRALGLFPDNAQIGMWAFSVGLGGGNQDYRALAPVRELGSAAGGGTHRDRLRRAFAKLPGITDGGTGLHDTTLAALRTVQDGYDARAVNSVILLTDGQNDDPGSLSLEQLLRTVEREEDPARPVPVIAIGMGPDADARALRRIAGATGGRSYVARDPADISQVFIDAMLNR